MSNALGRTRGKLKPPKKHGPTFSADDTWAKLSTNIVEILNHRAEHLSFEENHRYGYNMVLYKNGDTLYNGTCRLLSENLDGLAKKELYPAFQGGSDNDLAQRTQEGETLLKALRKVWDDHISGLRKLKDIFSYMDRVYTKSAKVPEIWEAGLKLFLERIIRPPIEDHLISAALTQIQAERSGTGINRSAVKGCVEVLLELREDVGAPSVYLRDLEPAILRESELHYRAEGEKLLATCSTPECLRKIEEHLAAEESRANHYLFSKTASQLRKILERNLIEPHLISLLSKPESGLDTMIDNEKLDDLSRLYRIFYKLEIPEAPPCLRKALRESIIRRGQSINSMGVGGDIVDHRGDDDAEDRSKGKGKAKARPNPASQLLSLALKWVQDVLDLKDKFNRIWTQSFDSDHEIGSTLDEAFGSFINLNEKAPEFISLFIDENLKKGLKGKTDLEVDEVLDKTMTVFRYLTDKDMFERYYKSHLAKRLLLGRSVSDDAERGMLAKLKVESGYQFTQRMEGMFHDMKISNETMNSYREHLAQTTPPEVEISVTVMTSTFWPTTYSSAPCVLPEALVKTSKSFEQFYLSKHSGRRLTFQPSLGNADVRVWFRPDKSHELNVATFALVILLLFEDVPEDEFLTYEEIKTATSIPEVELQRHLQSLACAKYKILKKHPTGRDIHSEDSFSFNSQFSAPLYKIKINTVASRVENQDERKETKDRIDEERKFQIDACIVRIMKGRQHMGHNDLVSDVTRQLATRFVPDPLDIKKRIEGLIEREFLERCTDRKSYNYVA